MTRLAEFPPWLDKPFNDILAVHQQGRLPHAVLIRAAQGWGEVELANRLALTLLGADETSDATTLAHPDLKWVQPEGSIIKVDEVRSLAQFAIGTRASANCKVAVVESAELMNLSAANALLKTLEEPPADNYLLLTTCRPARLLPTIVSRCQTFTVHRDIQRARSWLLDQWQPEQIEGKLFETGDAPMAVHNALSNGEPLLAPMLVSLAQRKPLAAGISELLEWDPERLTSGWYRHCAALLAGKSQLPGLKSFDDRSALAGFVDELNSVRHQLLLTNSANQRLLYERLAARWQGLAGTI
jgi:DNA polymerase-3 subunit delta'